MKGFTVDEKDFALLHALRQHLNISRAASQLHLTQSALSKRIKAIERDLGCSLLVRTSKGVRFTPEGELVLQRTDHICQELRQMRHQIESIQDEVCGSVSAGFSINYAQTRLPQLLAEYNRRYPDVQLDIKVGHSRDLIKQLQANQLDVAVLRGELPWEGVRWLLTEERVCVARTKELADVPLEELTYISHVTDSAQTSLMLRWLREQKLSEPQRCIRVAELNTCMSLVELGVGWALLPQIALESFDGSTVPCTFANGEPFLRRMYINAHQETCELPQIRAMVDLIKDGYRNESGLPKTGQRESSQRQNAAQE